MLKNLGKTIFIIILLLAMSYGISIILNKEIVQTSEGLSSFNDYLEEYCIQLLAEEVSSEYEYEMLKIHAILVRTTVYKQVQEEGDKFLKEIIEAEELDVLWKQKLENAWNDTEGQVVMYQDKLALVPFHQVSNGKTRSGEEVLGSADYPYLQSVECPQDVSAPNQIANQFIPITGVLVKSWDSTGYVTDVTVEEEIISGEVFRDTYGLASSCFEVQAFEGQTRILTKGVGHGLGLSQYTANEMAKEGKTSGEILQFFFPGTEIKEVAEILWNIE